jgi:subtilisin family serine protease
MPSKSSSRPARTLLAAAALGLSLVAAGPARAKDGGDPQLAGEALVRLDRTGSLGPLLAKYPLTLAAQFGARPIYRLKVIGNPNLSKLLGQLALEPSVLAAEPNVVHRSPEARKNVVWAIGTAQDYATQWAPAAMNLPAAQALATGAGVKVAVLDTGVDASHPALAGHLIAGYDFVDGDNDPSERGSTADLGYGHGTHVAGLIALAAPQARIMPLRVLDPSGQGNVWVLGEAMLRAIDPDGNPATDDGAQIINASLGTLDRTRIVEAVMKIASCNLPAPTAPNNDFNDPSYDGDRARCTLSQGAVIVAAAGNDASRSEQQYPAAENEYGLLPIAATASNGRLATFSNYGSWIEVAAPGDKITSSVPGGGYGTWSGTSMAAPLAAGTAALVMQRYPRMTAKDVARRIEDASIEICDTQQARLDALGAVKGTKAAGSCH